MTQCRRRVRLLALLAAWPCLSRAVRVKTTLGEIAIGVVEGNRSGDYRATDGLGNSTLPIRHGLGARALGNYGQPTREPATATKAGFKKWNLFDKGGPKYCDVEQGHIGTCYLQASLAAIAYWRPYEIESMFTRRDRWEWADPVYTLEWELAGRVSNVAVSDYVPTYKNVGAFANPHSGFSTAIWPMLLEKSWAKIFGSYFETSDGKAYEAILGITQAPTYPYWHEDFDEKAIWKRLRVANKLMFPVVASTSANAPNVGLATGHAYAILNAEVWQGEKMVWVYNPWGFNRYKGKLKDHSFETECHEFPMLMSEYMSAFKNTQIAEVRTGYRNSQVLLPPHGGELKIIASTDAPFDIQLAWPIARFAEAAGCKAPAFDDTAWLRVKGPMTHHLVETKDGSAAGSDMHIWIAGGKGEYQVTVHTDFQGDWIRNVSVRAYAKDDIQFRIRKDTSRRRQTSDPKGCWKYIERLWLLDNADQMTQKTDKYFPQERKSIGKGKCGDSAHGAAEQSDCDKYNTWKIIDETNE